MRGNTDQLLIRLGELNEKLEEVNRLYLDQEYERALEAIQNLEGEVFEVYDFAIKVKDQALGIFHRGRGPHRDVHDLRCYSLDADGEEEALPGGFHHPTKEDGLG